MTTKTSEDELKQQLAAIEHERWADWQKWMHKVLREANPSPEIGDILERWDRQIETPYAALLDKEQLSDMEQVDRYWPLIQEYIAQNYRPITQNKSQDELRTIIAQNISHAIQGVKEYPQKDIEDYYRNRGQWVDLMTERIMAAVESQTRSVTAIKEAIGEDEVVDIHPQTDGTAYIVDTYSIPAHHRNQFRAQIRAALQLDEGDV